MAYTWFFYLLKKNSASKPKCLRLVGCVHVGAGVNEAGSRGGEAGGRGEVRELEGACWETEAGWLEEVPT